MRRLFVLIAALFLAVNAATAIPRNVAIRNASTQDSFDRVVRGLEPTLWLRGDSAIIQADVELLTFTDAFDNAAWSPFEASVSPDQVAHPLTGDTTVDLLTESATASASHYIPRASGPSYTSGASYRARLYAKANGRTIIRLYANTSANYSWADYTLSGAGSVGSSNNVTASILSLGDGWYEIDHRFTGNATTTGLFSVYLNDGTGITYNGDGSSGVYLASASLKNLSSNVVQWDSLIGSISFTQSTVASQPVLSTSGVENLAVYSDDITGTGWNSNLGTVDNSEEFTVTATNGRVHQTIGVVSGDTYRLRFQAKNIDGNTSVLIRHVNMTGTTTGITLTSEWQWFSVELATTSTTVEVGLQDANGAGHGTFALKNFQFQRVNITPTYVATTNAQVHGSVTGRKGVVFDGSDDDMTSTSTLDDIINADAAEWFVVTVNTGVSTADRLFADDNGDFEISATTDPFIRYFNDDGSADTLAPSWAENVVSVVWGRHDGGNIYIQGAPNITATSAASGDTATVNGTLILGNNSAATREWNGTIYELITFDKVLTAPDRETIIDGLKTRYRIN